SHELRGRAGRTRELRTLARLHLDAVHRRADRDVAQRQRVAGLDRRIAARHQLIADLRALRRDDVSALVVAVSLKSDVIRAVRIVFNGPDAAGGAFLVALEVDHAVMLLRAAALVTGRDAAVVVASARVRLRLGQRRVRRALVQARRDDADHRAASCGSRFYCDQCHGCFTLGLGRHVHRVAFGKTHVCLALACARAGTEAERTGLALRVHHVHRVDLDAEEVFDRLLDVGLARILRNLEDVLVVFLQARALLRDVRRTKDAHDAFVLVHDSHSSTRLTDSTVMTTWSAPTSDTGSSAAVSTTCTYGTLRAARNSASGA